MKNQIKEKTSALIFAVTLMAACFLGMQVVNIPSQAAEVTMYEGEKWNIKINIDAETLKALVRLAVQLGQEIWNPLFTRHPTEAHHEIEGKHFWVLPVVGNHSRVTNNMDQPETAIYRLYPLGPKPAIEALVGAGFAVNADEAWDEDWTLPETQGSKVGEPFKLPDGDDHYIVSRDDDAWKKFLELGGKAVLLVQEGLSVDDVLKELRL